MTTQIHLLIIEEIPTVRQALEMRLRSSSQIMVLAAVPYPDTESQFDGLPLSDVTLLRISNRNDEQLDRTLELVNHLTARGSAVIVLTPFPNDVEQALVLEAGAIRYLPQAVNTPGLIAVIREVATYASASAESHTSRG